MQTGICYFLNGKEHLSYVLANVQHRNGKKQYVFGKLQIRKGILRYVFGHLLKRKYH